MGDYKIIASVSRTLRTLLLDRMDETPIDVTIAPPDVSIAGRIGRRVNLYLYLVNENGYLKNQEIPGEGHPADYGHPPLSLNLNYLLTAYGSSETNEDADLDAQQILGDAMRVLHDFAMVTGDLKITRPAAGIVGNLLLDSALLNEFEQVKLALKPASLDDMNKIWSALPKANFRRSVAYEMTVVQIESQSLRRQALPVKTRRLHLLVSQRPEITTVYRTPTLPNEPIGDPRVRLGQSLTIEGMNFNASKTWVRIGTLEPIGVTPVSNEKIQITLPDNTYPADFDHPLARPIPVQEQLWPGPQIVQVLIERPTEVVQGGLDKGTTTTDAKRLNSNAAVFMLVPTLSGINPAGNSSALLTVNGARLFADNLKSFVLVGDVAISVRKPRPGDPWVAPTAISVQVPLSSLATALPLPPAMGQPYPVRMQVNGAQSTEDGVLFTLMP